MSQLELFTVPDHLSTSNLARIHGLATGGEADVLSIQPPVIIPEDDSPGCHQCKLYTAKAIPLSKIGALIGHAGDCSLQSREVLSYAWCSAFQWVNEEARQRDLAYLLRVGRPPKGLA